MIDSDILKTTTIGKNRGRITLILCLLFILLNACVSQRTANQVETIPLAPMELIGQWSEFSEVTPLRAPLHTRDTRYPYFGYSPEGEQFGKHVDEVLFPTDVLVVQVDGNIRHVFLARSPHGGCFIRWNGGWPYAELPNWAGGNFFDEPCLGSRWDIDGLYIAGPSPRNMDELPFEVKDGMFWVTGEIILWGPASLTARQLSAIY